MTKTQKNLKFKITQVGNKATKARLSTLKPGGGGGGGGGGGLRQVGPQLPRQMRRQTTNATAIGCVLTHYGLTAVVHSVSADQAAAIPTPHPSRHVANDIALCHFFFKFRLRLGTEQSEGGFLQNSQVSRK
ncbi:hypothetical protein JYU34_005400 [Plutella xylostella]|uniref:Uncharacterized protein n=1 Tax=Plutella xylostella TaxID=51655 RepID=A0ABQ7QWL7_PLUXY|nr:hypothetical protein JYU34_005400 [Plutella xylostella]